MGQTQIKLSYSVVKDMYNNVWHHELSKKQIITQLLKSKSQIISYMEDLVHDIRIVGNDHDMSSYKKGVKELAQVILDL